MKQPEKRSKRPRGAARRRRKRALEPGITEQFLETETFLSDSRTFHTGLDQHAYGWEYSEFRDDDYFIEHGNWGYLKKAIIQAIEEGPSFAVLPPDFCMGNGDLPLEAGPPEPSPTTEYPELDPPSNLEKQLHEFCGKLHYFYDPDRPLSRIGFFENFVDSGSLAKLRPFLETSEDENFVVHVCLFARFWIRSPETWVGQGRASLISHLFLKYECPTFLMGYWTDDLSDELPSCSRSNFPSEWHQMLILLGQGCSLKTAAAEFDWGNIGPLRRYLDAAPEGWSGASAILLARILSQGGSEVEYGRISQHQYFQNRELRWANLSTFAEETARWLVRHRESLSNEDCELILNWGIHERTEMERGLGFREYGNLPDFWAGRSPEASLRRARDYEQGLIDRMWSQNASLVKRSWATRGWNFTVMETDELGEEIEWSFEELNHTDKLREEGISLGHCVGSYASRCYAGDCAIISLKKNRERRITIELSTKKLSLVQARGQRNRPAYQDEMRIIEHWLNEVVQPRLPSESETQE